MPHTVELWIGHLEHRTREHFLFPLQCNPVHRSKNRLCEQLYLIVITCFKSIISRSLAIIRRARQIKGKGIKKAENLTPWVISIYTQGNVRGPYASILSLFIAVLGLLVLTCMEAIIFCFVESRGSRMTPSTISL
jgi:hypothetical protein